MTVTAAAPRTRPSISFVEIRDTLKPAEIYSVHPEVMGLISKSAKEQQHVQDVRESNATLRTGEKPQTEFLIVKFPKAMSLREVGDAADLLYRVRGKSEGVSPDKVHRLVEKGYMLVPEAGAVDVLRKILPPNTIKDAASSGRATA